MNPPGPPAPPAPSPWTDLAWVTGQSLLLLALVAAGPLFPASWHHPLLVALGAVFFLLAAYVGIRGMLDLGRNRTPFPPPRPGSRLVQHGLYARVRHPLYLSVVLAGLSWTFLWQSAPTALVTVALAAYLDRKAHYEERLLMQAFPDYPDYCRRVRRWLPFPVRNPGPGACR